MTKLVNSCGECPNYQYYSGGTHVCTFVDLVVTDKTQVSKFCPLPQYPAQVIADLHNSLREYQTEEEKLGLRQVVLRQIAAGFKTVVSNFRSIVFKATESERWPTKIILSYDCITEVDIHRDIVHFFYEEGKYKVFRVKDGWEMQAMVELDGKELWTTGKLVK
jgi:hypothetical protein